MKIERRKGAMITARKEMEKEGLAISAADLARLVDARLRRSTKGGTIDHEAIAAEIESTLDLVEHCQWLMCLRRVEWAERTNNWCKPYFTAPEPPAEREARLRVEAASLPIPFDKALILLGVGGNNSRQREDKFYPFYRGLCLFGAQMNHRYGHLKSGQAGTARELDDFIEPTEAEFRAMYERRKTEGWSDAKHLLRERRQFQQWNLEQTKEKRSKAGKASGKARKPKAKSSKRGKAK
jgi:hypothetical protein